MSCKAWDIPINIFTCINGFCKRKNVDWDIPRFKSFSDVFIAQYISNCQYIHNKLADNGIDMCILMNYENIIILSFFVWKDTFKNIDKPNQNEYNVESTRKLLENYSKTTRKLLLENYPKTTTRKLLLEKYL